MKILRILSLAALAAAVPACRGGGDDDAAPPPAPTPVTIRASVDSTGMEGTGATTSGPSISSDGRYVAFHSNSTDLVPGDTNGTFDIFVRDTSAGTTTRVSVDSAGSEGNGGSLQPSISPDGRYVAFTSLATNLVAGDANGVADVFVHDRVTGTTSRVSVDSAGVEANAISQRPQIALNGLFVVFDSLASNLVGDDTNGTNDIFVRDVAAGTTIRASLDSAGFEGTGSSTNASISSDGRYVAFQSFAATLVAGDTNLSADIFVRDTVAGTTVRASVHTDGTEANDDSDGGCAISADGRHVAFWSRASNLVTGDANGVADTFIRDTVAGTTARISVDSAGLEGNGPANPGEAISADNRYVVFTSSANNLVTGDTNSSIDIFVRDLVAGTTVRVSVDSAGAQSMGGINQQPSISGDGRHVTFQSGATNLVTGDTNGVDDIFVRGPLFP